VQYNELGGVQDNEFLGGGGGGNPAYAAALTVLSGLNVIAINNIAT
jgi:hypothetical protein